MHRKTGMMVIIYLTFVASLLQLHCDWALEFAVIKERSM